jgi:hypothetical protein
MKNFIKNITNKQLWLIAKVAGTAFNSVSTWDIFKQELRGHGEFVATTATILAVFLIDIMYIALLGFLEEPIRDDETIAVRWAYVMGLFALYLSIVVIGFKDSGLMAFAPRIGLGIMTVVTTGWFVADWRAYKDSHWEIFFERDKVRQERKDARQLSEKQRTVKNKQMELAIMNIADELQAEYVQKLRRQLLTITLHADPVIDQPVSDSVPLISEPKQKQLPEPNKIIYGLPEYISYIPSNPKKKRYRWECECGKDGYTSTPKGARIAHTKHTNNACTL